MGLDATEGRWHLEDSAGFLATLPLSRNELHAQEHPSDLLLPRPNDFAGFLELMELEAEGDTVGLITSRTDRS